MSKEHSAPVDFRNAFLSTKRVLGILARLRLLRSPTAGSNPRNQHAGGTDGGRSLPCFPGGTGAFLAHVLPPVFPVYIHYLSSTREHACAERLDVLARPPDGLEHLAGLDRRAARLEREHRGVVARRVQDHVHGAPAAVDRNR